LTTPESQLLAKAREYDAQSLAQIHDQYAEPVYRFLYRYTGDAAQAEDLTSEVFLKLLRSLGTRQAPRDNLEGWLYRVGRNLANDWYRKHGRRATTSLDAEPSAGEKIADEGISPEELAEERLAYGELRAVIQNLTQDQQQVIMMRFGEGRKISEISRLMGKSEGAIKILQYRAIRRLRKFLERTNEVNI
jgi:RNA polymerase sigma-70 factor (ECF subfamily)